MINVNRRLSLQLFFILTGLATAQLTTAAEPETEFRYSDEWALVSAPPPAGPYQPINIDPRVPGPGTVSQMPLAMPHLPSAPAPAAENAAEEAGAIDVTEADRTAANPLQAASEVAPALPPVPGLYQPLSTPAAEQQTVAGEAETAAMQAQSEEQIPASPDFVPATEAGMAAASEVAAGSGEDLARPPSPEDNAATQAAVPGGESLPERGPEMAIQTESAVESESSDLAASVPVPMPESAGQEPLPLAQESATPPQLEEEVPAPPVAAMPQQPEYGQPAMMPPGYEPQQMPGYAEAPMPAPPVAAMPQQPEYGQPGMMPPQMMPPGYQPQQSATAQQEPPSYPSPSMPEYYERLAPPAAGRMNTDTPAAGRGPAAQVRERPYGQDATGGYYGRPSPGYAYPAPGNPYQSGRQGYWGMPPYGYSRGQAWTGEQDVPPPPVANDPAQYPYGTVPGYR